MVAAELRFVCFIYIGDHFSDAPQLQETLANGLTGYLKSSSESMPAGMRIMTFIFVAKCGLEITLERSVRLSVAL
jgi:hypothetical protein